MAITRLSGGLTPADGADPRTFPTIWNEAVDELEVGFRLVGIRYFTANGTFAKADPFDDGNPDGVVVRAVRVKVQAGGGGGGGCSSTTSTQVSSGGSGGGGAYAESFITDIAGLDTSVSVTVGGGGSGGDAGNNNGANGGASSFGTLVTASGGNPGLGRGAQTPPLGRSGASGAPQTTGTGQLVVPGGTSPFPAVRYLSVDFCQSLLGGSSALGVGGQGRDRVSTQSGQGGDTGKAFGGGGTGGANAADQEVGQTGAAGANGIVIVEVFA